MRSGGDKGGRAFLIPILAVLVQAAAPAPAEDLFAVVERAGEGHADAQFRMGLIYFEGDIVSKAAEQGDALAQNNLGALYANADGVERDDARAYAWTGLAAGQGDGTAKDNLTIIRRGMSTGDLIEGWALAARLGKRIRERTAAR